MHILSKFRQPMVHNGFHRFCQRRRITVIYKYTFHFAHVQFPPHYEDEKAFNFLTIVALTQQAHEVLMKSS